jgi:hypothetical protein
MDASRLINVLEQQSNVYQVLVDLSQKMQDAIMINNITKIDSLIKMQMALVMKLSSLERKRSEIAKDISHKVSVPEENLNISEVKKHLGEEQFSKLETLEMKLNESISVLAEINNTNSMLINNGLDLIEYSLEILGVTKDSTYNIKGNNNHKQIIDEKV